MKKKIFILFCLFLFLVSIFWLNLFFGVQRLEEIERSLKNGDFVQARRNIFLAKTSLKATEAFFLPVKALSFFGFNKDIKKAEDLFSLTKIFFEGVGHGILAAEEGKKISGGVMGEKVDFKNSFTEIKIQLVVVFEKISLSQTLLTNFSGKEPFVGRYLLKMKTNFPRVSSLLSQGQTLAQVLPELLGIEGRKTYLFLFQNNMELRPTGGFIGSYGLLTLDQGRLLDFTVQDVYWADGQLRGYVEPPPKLEEFLGADSWYLRDSNWDPDFPVSALKAEWFLEKETGRQVDGVVAVDLFVAQRLLDIFGEIDLPDYGQKVNAQNFFEKAQFQAEIGFFPGSTGKQDFLGAVSRALFEKLQQADERELFATAGSFYQGLLEKDILIYLNDEKARETISRLNWDGAIKRAKCEGGSGKCLEDYLMVVEANVGVNKANYFLKRNLEVEAEISNEGVVRKKLTIFYDNQSPSNIFPAGRYKNYLRVYVPQGSTLKECRIENARLTDGQGECRIEETQEHQKKVFGVLIEVPVGEKRQVNLSWLLPGNLREGKYLFLLQKQSGTKSDDLTFAIKHPSFLTGFPKTAGFLTNGNVLRYNTVLSKDLVFEIDFVGK